MAKDIREFEVEMTGWAEVHELPGGWSGKQFMSLLERLDVDGVEAGDAAEMAMLALQDLEPDEAAGVVLETVFGDTMRPGVRQNLAHDLTEERPWEDFADLNHQAGIFDAVVLLQRTFPRHYDKPDAVSLVLRIDTTSQKGREWLGAPAVDPALLIRILAEGMDDRAVLRRLFGESIRGQSFTEAADIIWRVSKESGRGRGVRVQPDFQSPVVRSAQGCSNLGGEGVARCGGRGRLDSRVHPTHASPG